MLDDISYIKRFDTDDMLGVLGRQQSQLAHNFETELDFNPKQVTAIVVAGMGGSALAADLVSNWLSARLSIPFVIVRDYDLPNFVDENTLVICSSYSGNTEESLSAYEQAGERNSQRIVITQGGTLVDRAKEDDVASYLLPGGYQPRMAVWYGVKAFADLLEQAGWCDGLVDELESSIEWLEQSQANWKAEFMTADNQAKQVAESCMGKSVWIYSGPKLAASAYKWKININENSKHVSAWNVLPEFNHNEFLGWTEQPQHKPFTVVQLRSGLDNQRTQKRFDVTNRLLSGRMPHPIEIEAKGETHIQQMLWSCLLGDYVSAYLGVLNGVNPTRVDAIEKFKKELS